jgi:hypothetical protein
LASLGVSSATAASRAAGQGRRPAAPGRRSRDSAAPPGPRQHDPDRCPPPLPFRRPAVHNFRGNRRRRRPARPIGCRPPGAALQRRRNVRLHPALPQPHMP